MRTSLIELNLACDDVIFSRSDNFLSDGKHNLTFVRLGQSPGSRLAQVMNQYRMAL